MSTMSAPPTMITAATAQGSTGIVGPDAAEVAARLRFSATRLARLLRQQDQGGLSPTSTAALATIAREGPLTLGELAAAEQVAPPTITKAVHRLEKDHLVTRKTDDADRRVCRVAVTKEGQRLLDASRSRRTAWLAKRLGRLTPDDLARLDEAMDVLEQLTRCEPPR